MTGVYLVNRPYLEVEFNRKGIMQAVENFIENAKEQVRNLVLDAGEEFAVDSKMIINDGVYKVLARFKTLESEDKEEDRLGAGESTQMKIIKFTSVDLIKEQISKE